METRKKPELLCPAGDFERLRLAVAYGADAVYLAGTAFGMRAFAGNFSPEDLPRAVAYAHERGVRVHVTVNTMPRNDEAARLPAYLEQLDAAALERAARLLAGAAPASGDAARDRALEQLLYHVGRWIYLVDAWDDLADDRRTGSYNPISARFGGETEANRDYLRTTLRHSLNLARSAAALLELGHWRGTGENILFLGLPMVEELVFTGRWKAVNQHNRRQNP